MIDPSQHLPEGATSWLDAGAVVVFVFHLLGVVSSPLLTLLTILWLALRCWESVTVQGWVKRFRKSED